DVGLKLDQHVAAAEIGGRAHLLEPCQVLELRLHGPEQEAFGVFRRDALIYEAHIDDRNRHVGLCLLRDRQIRERTRHQEERQDGQSQPGVAYGYSDRIHCFASSYCAGRASSEASLPTSEASAGTGLTTSPAFTRS